MKMYELLKSKELEGYENTEGNEIDYEVAAHTPCPSCGGPCEYAALVNPRNNSYRAFAVCLKCDEAVEF